MRRRVKEKGAERETRPDRVSFRFCVTLQPSLMLKPSTELSLRPSKRVAPVCFPSLSSVDHLPLPRRRSKPLSRPSRSQHLITSKHPQTPSEINLVPIFGPLTLKRSSSFIARRVLSLSPPLFTSLTSLPSLSSFVRTASTSTFCLKNLVSCSRSLVSLRT